MREIIINSKITIPATNTKSPSYLLNLVYQDIMSYQHFVVVAPSGFGKTDFFVDLARISAVPVCWYSLDMATSLHHFVSHFVAAVAQQFPKFGQQSMAQIDQNSLEKNLEQLIPIIISELQSIRQSFIFVLDNFQVIRHEVTTNTFVNYLIKESESHCRFVIICRQLLVLPGLASMINLNQIGTIVGYEGSVFSNEVKDETQTTIKKVGLAIREVEVLTLLAGGLDQEQIAMVMSIKISSVSKYITRIKEKLQVSNQVQAVRWAVHIGLVDI